MKEEEKKKTPVSNYGKFGLIDHIARNATSSNKTTVTGIGDDCSVIESGDNLTLVTTDLLLEGIHFNLVYTPLRHLGYKAVIRAVADIYAMNGVPGQLLVGLGISSRFSVEQVDELYEGICLACKKHRTDLAGGDITSSLTGITISLTAVGIAERNSLVKRSGGRPNDLVCVTGNFGASFMGLQVLERERKLFDKNNKSDPDFTGYEYVIGRQLKPEFPSDIISKLKDSMILPTSMIDVSDGLASDLLHICKQSGTGCRIFYDKIPIDQETFNVAEEFNIDPVTAALNGGEDYELLFTVDLKDFEKVKEIPSIRIIGHLTSPDKGYALVTESGNELELKAQGWERG